MAAEQRDLPSRAAPDTAELDASVVIPTHRRDDLLERCLRAVLTQRYRRDHFEVVVVDDAQSATVPPLVARVAAEHPGVAVRSLPGPGRGPAAARNVGWRAAAGRIIAFIDDDAYPEDDRWLYEGVQPFDDPNVVAVSGRVTVPTDDPPTDFQRNVKGLESGEFLTCNVFYRRDVLERVGGFDERFTAPFREDSDLQYRVAATGGRMLRTDRARVAHPAPPGRFGVALRLQRYSMFNALIYKKHPHLYRRRLQPNPPAHYYAIVATALLAIGAFLAGRRRFAVLAALRWLFLTTMFFVQRARGVSHAPLHLVDLALTSALIPPLSVYWRLRGALRYRVWFA
ncbi:MAG: glycosyltransferase [Dehalococcoidia bacterium]